MFVIVGIAKGFENELEGRYSSPEFCFEAAKKATEQLVATGNPSGYEKLEIREEHGRALPQYKDHPELTLFRLSRLDDVLGRQDED